MTDSIEAAAHAVFDEHCARLGLRRMPWHQMEDSHKAEFIAYAKASLAALAVVPLPEWRPIETAPKDGVFVLITDGDVVQIGYYEDHLMAWRSDAAQCRLWSDPTHWQPLPAPPERAGT